MHICTCLITYINMYTYCVEHIYIYILCTVSISELNIQHWLLLSTVTTAKFAMMS